MHRQQWLIDTLANASDGALPLQPATGACTCCTGAHGTDDETLSRQAQAAGVMLAPLSRYACNQTAVAGCWATQGHGDEEILRCSAG